MNNMSHLTKKYHDVTYLELVKYVLRNGVSKNNRTKTETRSVFGYQMRFDLSNYSIPLLTTKKMFTRGIIHEILWYLQGNTNIKYLQDNNVHIWNEWANKNGDLGPVYGAMWRSWPGKPEAKINYETDPPTAYIEYTTIDQIATTIQQLRSNPNNRRNVVSAWNPSYLPDNSKTFDENVENGNQALPPCHALFQFWTNGFGKLSCQLYQRSCDVGLGVPFNIVQYSILTHMIAHVTGHTAAEFIWTGGDVHIYNNHIEQLTKQYKLMDESYPSPTLELNPNVKEIDDFQYDDFNIIGYDKYHPSIKMEVSI